MKINKNKFNREEFEKHLIKDDDIKRTSCCKRLWYKTKTNYKCPGCKKNVTKDIVARGVMQGIDNLMKEREKDMSIKLLQTKIGATSDGKLGPNTMKAAMDFYKLTPAQTAHFFGQVSHETGGFKTFSENLNYSATGLIKIFKKYFTEATALSYARKPEKIANKVYGNRMGNGTEASGDGYKFRGRGALQLTGKSNYEAFSKYLKKPEIMDNPDLVATEYVFESAIFFFEKNKLWSICNEGVTDATILKLTKKINGGTNGLSHRAALTKKYYNLLIKVM